MTFVENVKKYPPKIEATVLYQAWASIRQKHKICYDHDDCQIPHIIPNWYYFLKKSTSLKQC